jgi:hypothetical protein
MSRVRLAPFLLVVAATAAACGGGSSSPAAPATPVAASTPTPTPTPSLTALYGCPLPTMPNLGTTCPKEKPILGDYVTDAIDKVIREHPEYFDLNDASGGGSFKVLDRSRYIGAVVANIRARSVCAIEEKEEIALKTTNQYNEQYNIWTSSGYIRRPPGAYITTCYPAQF